MQYIEELGFDEVWIGEHHSAGWEYIGSPEVFIAHAAAKTSRIKLGTGMVSLPYHNPFMALERMILLDHLTRGRVMFGVGPGSLPTDAEMIGLEPRLLRPMLEEAVEAIMALLALGGTGHDEDGLVHAGGRRPAAAAIQPSELRDRRRRDRVAQSVHGSPAATGSRSCRSERR